MAYDYFELVEKTQDWAKQAGATGWISQETERQLTALDTRTPDNLFGHHGTRPLIVAFMGGSGVGKSTLLNRLAGKAIARTGIERPTSREVTLFHHHSIAIQNLPEQLPITQIKIAQHDEEAQKNLIWIDMPDFDSTEQSNKQLVLQWLPHIDILVYVVSPERYRDEKAWQLLLAEGARHAWLFVINQWDRGQEEQFEDFRQQLHKAGFYEPIIFKTACTENLQADEFAELETTINSLATTHVVEQLEQRGMLLRRQELTQKLQAAQALLGDADVIGQLNGQWQQQWHTASLVLQQGFAWPLQNKAAYYAEHAADLLANAHANNMPLWDEWAQTRLDDALDELLLNIDQHDIPSLPLKTLLLPVRDKAAKIMHTQTELSARQALANPGNMLQRLFLKGMRLCEIILPLAAMAWVGSQVFLGYYHSNTANTPYLGVDFAIHSGLLIALTWLAPFFMLQKIQPSLKKSALRGLNKGLAAALNNVESEITTALETFGNQHQEHRQYLETLIGQCSCAENAQHRLSLEGNNPLARMLME